MNDPNARPRRSKLTPEQQRALRSRLEALKSDSTESAIPRRPEGSSVPLTLAQRPLWFIEQLDPNQAAYNLVTAYLIRGPLDADALESSVNHVAHRHEAWRTTISSPEGAQVVSPKSHIRLDRVDLRDAKHESPVQAARAFANENVRRPFDLGSGPLMRTWLLRLAEEEHVFLLCAHHIVYDGWSAGVFAKELAASYESLLKGQEPRLPDLPVQFGDFAVWQAGQIASGSLNRQLAYWSARLAGLPVLEVPTDRPRPPVQTFHGAKRRFALSEDLTRRLRDFSREEGVSLFTTLLAAFNVLLHRYSRQDDIAVGSPVAGRDHLELEGLIGCFVNTLVLRSDVSGDPAFREYLHTVKRTSLEAFSNQEAPFASIVDAVNPTREHSRNPLFSEAFTFVSEMLAPPNIAALTVEPFETDSGTCMFDSTLLLGEEGGRIAGYFEYNTDLFDEETIARRIGHYQVLLDAILSDPEQTVSRLPLLTEKESATLLHEWTPSGVDRYEQDACIHRLFEKHADRTPERIAISHDGDSISYLDLDRRANQLARHLQSQGVGPEILVGIYLDRSPELIVAILGILKAGGAYVPMDASYPTDRLSHMIGDAGLGIVLTSRELRDNLPENGAAPICVDSEWDTISRESPERPECGAGPHNVAYVIYTSGSTGRPKGCVIEHRNVVRLFSATQHWFEFDENDVWTLFHSSAFDFSVWEIWGALIYGGRLVIVPHFVSRSPDSFYEMLVDEQVTVLNQTPSAFVELIRAEERLGVADGLALRTVIFGGEALDFRTLGPWFSRHADDRPRLVNMYGITETTVHVTYRAIEEADAAGAEGSVIGRPIPDLRIYVLDPKGQPAPIGVPGEIHVGGAGVARGYLNREELTAERFVPNPFDVESEGKLYRTGDLARYRRNGDLEYLGRIDHQVKIRGFRIELGEIESVLGELDGIRQIVVLAREDSPGDARLVAYLVADAGRYTSEELRGHLRQHVPEYMVPSAFVRLDEFPLTSNGKIDRRALPAPDTSRRELSESVVAPGSELESKLAGIWREALGVEQVGVTDNFFDLGGHSLLMVQIQTEVQSLLGRGVPMVDLFRYPTVHALADHLGSSGPSGPDLGEIDSRAEKQKAARRRQRSLRGRSQR